MGISWSDLYSGQQVSVQYDETGTPVADETALTEWASENGQLVELDEGGKALLELIPEQRRDDFIIPLKNQLAIIRAAIGDSNYLLFCADMKKAGQLWLSGDRDSASQILASYSIPLAMLESLNA